jgi:chromosome segregation ATPase
MATVTTAAATPATGAAHVQVATSLAPDSTATVDRADDEVQVAMQLARFGDSSADIDRVELVDQAQPLLSASQGELGDVRSQVHAPHIDVVSREETIRMQDEDILSSRMERLQLKSTFGAMERLVQAVQSQLQVTQADIASRDETIMKLNQDLQALRSDQEIELQQLKSTLTATEGELSLVRSQVDVAKADIASKDDTIKKLNRDVEVGRRQIDSSKEILLQRNLDAALQESALKEEAIQKLKSDIKAAKDGFSKKMQIAQMNVKDQVTHNFQQEVQDLKKQVHD